MSEKLPSYGGQAVLEGVMMRGSAAVAMAVRTPEGKIEIHTETLNGIYQSKIAKIPFLRGLVLLWDSFGLGLHFLTLSANYQTGEEEKIEGPGMYLSFGISLIIGVGFFFLLPAYLGQLTEQWLGVSVGWSNFLEGIMRLLLMVGYLWAIGKIPDIRRVFSYHGAEHKTINGYEAGAPLTPESISHYSVEHPRCGTAFLLTLMVLSIILFTILGPLPVILRLLTRILFIPVLAGLAYEFIRWTARHMSSTAIRWIIRPNLALQHLTTNEPTLDMLEVSIAAFNAMLELENQQLSKQE
jgi:uncharacterized protein YqhQ